MGDKSPENKFNRGNYYQQKYHDKNYYKDRYNDRYDDKYLDKYNNRNKGRNRDKGYNNYRNNKNYDNRRSDSRSRDHHNNYNKSYNRNKNYKSKSKSRSRSKSLNNRHKIENKNEKNEKKEEKIEINNNNNQKNQNQINPMQMNQIQMQNYFNNYMNANSEFFKKIYQINNNNNSNNINNPNNNKIFVPIGIPINYFYGNISQNNNINKQNFNNSNQNNIQQNNNNKEKEKEKEEPSNTILITDLDTNITKDVLEDIFHEKCLKLQISLPIDIRLVEALNTAYIIFPSVTSCVIVYNSLNNKQILINGKYYPCQFSPNLTQNYNNNRDTLTYVTQISTDKNLTTSMETTVHEDWYCVYCNSKNFSRRIVCFKCQKPKSINSRVVPVIKQKKIILGKNGEILPNNSIIVQGKQIMYSNEGEVFIKII